MLRAFANILMMWVFAAAWTWAAVFPAIVLMGIGLHHLLATLIGSTVITLLATIGLRLWKRQESRYD